MFDISPTDWLVKKLLPPKPDPRLDAYPLMGSWTPTALISIAYVIGVYAWRAESLKQQRRKLKGNSSTFRVELTGKQSWDHVKCLMILYNAVMVLYSAFVTIGTIWSAIDLGYGLGCEALSDPTDRRTDKIVFFGYLFYFSKFVEMLDTVFFLWRGKVDQVTFLHVFHHATMPPSIWWGLKYAPGGIVFMFPLANSLIHVVMYTYYGMAAAGAYKYLWWKNYLTLAQMIQFVILIVHQGQIFIRSTPCNFPKVFPAAIVCYATLFLILFGNFYVKAYWRKQRLAKVNRYQKEQKLKSIPETITQNGYNTKFTQIANGYINHHTDPITERKKHH